MKWFKKKGLWFCVWFEILTAAVFLLGSIAMIAGYVLEVVIAVAILVVIGVFAAGGDISV